MKILSVDINNFLVIGKAKVNLSDRGIVLVQGENEVDGSANSNGAGKSSLVDAISWCLYGITARGVVGDDVVNNKVAKDCRVVVNVEDDGSKYQIIRHRKHKTGKNSLLLMNGEKDATGGTSKLTQESINKIIGCSADVFNTAVYAGQEQMPDLPGMTDKQLKMLIEEAAGVERLQQAHIVAIKKLSVAKSKMDAIESNVVSEMSGREDDGRKLTDALDKHSAYKRGVTGDIVKAAADAHDARDESDKLEKLRMKLRDESAIRSDIGCIADDIARNKGEVEKLGELKNVLIDLEYDLKVAQRDVRVATMDCKKQKKSIDDIDDVVGTPCGECGKEYRSEDIGDARDAMKSKLRNKLVELKTLKESMESLRNAVNIANNELNKFASAMIDVSEVLERHGALTSELEEVNGFAHKVTKQSDLADKLDEKVLRLKESSELNPFDKLIEMLRENLKSSEEREMMLRDDLKKSESLVEVTNDAVEIFGRSGVRAHIIDTVTPFLNEKTAEYLTELTEGSISAIWSTISKTSKGELREKFGIAVEKENGAKNFRGLSGGEKRKVRIATSMALQDLVASRASKPISLYMADEIDDALDTSGLERLMGVLTAKSREKGTVLVISHNNLSDWIEKEITVRNVGGVSTVDGAV